MFYLKPPRHISTLPFATGLASGKCPGMVHYAAEAEVSHDGDDVRGLPALDHTLEAEPKRAIRPKGKFTVVENAIFNFTQDCQGTRHRYPGDVAQPRRRSD
jgi:hypothetical protein